MSNQSFTPASSAPLAPEHHKTEVVLACEGLSRHFQQGSSRIEVVKGVDFALHRGESVSIIGQSGSGKSTLLQLLGGLDQPSAGEVRVNGVGLSSLTDAELGQLRNRSLGFVYQFHHLLAEFSALENVAMPLLIRGVPIQQAQAKAKTLLEQVGLGHRVQHAPAELSGGERQRTAIARALVTEPQCLLADEPTGNLDEQTADQVFSLLLQLKRELGTALIIVTHDTALAARTDRCVRLTQGQIVEPESLASSSLSLP